MVIRSNGKGYLICLLQHEARVHLLSCPVALLVGDWPVYLHWACSRGEDEIASRVRAHLVGALESKCDGASVSTGGDQVIKLQSPARTVEGQINTGIDIPVAHLPK